MSISMFKVLYSVGNKLRITWSHGEVEEVTIYRVEDGSKCTAYFYHVYMNGRRGGACITNEDIIKRYCIVEVL